MEDKLKQWVSGQREDFDVYELDLESGWNDIAGKIGDKPGKNVFGKRFWYSIAASIVILLFAGSAFLYSYSNSNSGEQLFSNNQELAEASDYYTSEINFRLAAARELVDDQSIFEDIDELDKAFAELKNDLKDDADNEEVIIAMMENYQLKLKILDRILKHLRKDQKNSSREEYNENI